MNLKLIIQRKNSSAIQYDLVDESMKRK